MNTYKIQVFKSVLVRDGAAHIAMPHLGQQMRHSQHCADILHTYLKDADVEHFVVLWLDQKNKIIGLRTVSTGSLTASVVHPREVFIGTSDGRVASIIVGHNHPSGNTAPSAEDRALTARLVQAGQILGIPITDHIIVGFDFNGTPTPYFSFMDNGLLTAP
jgi:DNA repair protein RadC